MSLRKSSGRVTRGERRAQGTVQSRGRAGMAVWLQPFTALSQNDMTIPCLLEEAVGRAFFGNCAIRP